MGLFSKNTLEKYPRQGNNAENYPKSHFQKNLKKLALTGLFLEEINAESSISPL